MDLPDCPPGAEGYQDSVVDVVTKKPDIDDPANCTKAEQEFHNYLNSLKIKTDNDNYRSMVERRGRDVSGKWIYLCYPCAAVCSGEGVLQTHISGKKHKNKLNMRSTWPSQIFEEHPYILSEKGVVKSNKAGADDKVLKKMAEEVENHNAGKTEMDLMYDKYRDVRCHIQDALDSVRTPLLGIEYLVEHPPEQPHHEPSYMCTLCIKQGYPRTIINHLTCFWHRYNYLLRHYSAACALLAPYRNKAKFREGIAVIVSRLATRIQAKYGRLRPVNIDKEEYEKNKDQIHKWIVKGKHFSENKDCTFEEVVDADLINSLDSSKINVDAVKKKNRDPSPPVVTAPARPFIQNAQRRGGTKRGSADSLSDISDEPDPQSIKFNKSRGRGDNKRFAPFPNRGRDADLRDRRDRYPPRREVPRKSQEKERPKNYQHKLQLVRDQRAAAEDVARKALAYHEKNPEKHPLYPEEWKKFWNRRYKEIQAEGKDPSKHDFKPEWILYWTARMKELHDEELRANLAELYRRLRVTPPDEEKSSDQGLDRRRSPARRKSPERRRSPPKRRSLSPAPKRRSLSPKRRSPSPKRRSPSPKRRSPSPKRRSPSPKRRPPPRRRSPFQPRRRSPDYRAIERRSPERRSPRRRSPLRLLRTRSRSPVHRAKSPARKPARSPLSQRESAPRNQSPRAVLLDTVLISDDELKPDKLSPWNSEDSLGSLPEARSPVHLRSRTGSVVSRSSRRPDPHAYYERPRDVTAAHDLGAAENVVATLRLLVALEDYLGSLGPKVVDLLADALKMEKAKANSSEELLESETAVVLIETAKEKLKGAVQAGLVASSAAAAVRTAVIRAASTLHEADIRIKKKKQEVAKNTPECKEGSGAVPVAGVGAVNREEIAKQMAAALIAQGKTDVSSEELAQLIDAVVGMAEAKKREAESKKKAEARAANNDTTRRPDPTSGTASALQMLQSAYDEKKVDKEETSVDKKEEAPDAMDGLSDSDLETLLKNFNELSAEEQHSLIAYLKKLEAREPARVEKLRRYVSAAAATAPPPDKPAVDLDLVAIESDDDDYTVEDVFKSAKQKVKEDQIRQEMEIVKKSIEEATEPPKEIDPVVTSAPEVKTNLFSATDLLALVQASIQSTPAPTAASAKSDVVTSNTQPRSFGDLPEPASTDTSKTNLQNPITSANNQTTVKQGSARNTLITLGGGNDSETNADWEPKQVPVIGGMNTPLNTSNQELRVPKNNHNQEKSQGNYNQGPQGNYNQGPQRNYNQGPQGNYDQGPQGNYDQGPQGNYNQGSQGIYNQGPLGNYNQGSQGNYNEEPQGNYNQEPQGNYNQGPQGVQGNYNQGLQGNFSQGSQGNSIGGAPDNIGQQGNYSQSWGQQSNNNQGLYENYSEGRQDDYNQGSSSQLGQGNFSHTSQNYAQTGRNNYNQNVRPPQGNFNQGPRPMDNFHQGSQFTQNTFNQPPSLMDNSYNHGIAQVKSGPGRGANNSFTQGRGNNRFDGNKQPQPFGNQNQNNYRGRGRGFGGQRGRGRGYY